MHFPIDNKRWQIAIKCHDIRLSPNHHARMLETQGSLCNEILGCLQRLEQLSHLAEISKRLFNLAPSLHDVFVGNLPFILHTMKGSKLLHFRRLHPRLKEPMCLCECKLAIK